MKSLSACKWGAMECDNARLGGKGVWTGLQPLIPYFSRSRMNWRCWSFSVRVGQSLSTAIPSRKQVAPRSWHLREELDIFVNCSRRLWSECDVVNIYRWEQWCRPLHWNRYRQSCQIQSAWSSILLSQSATSYSTVAQIVWDHRAIYIAYRPCWDHQYESPLVASCRSPHPDLHSWRRMWCPQNKGWGLQLHPWQ